MISNKIYARYTVVLKDLIDDADIKPKIDLAMSTYPLYEQRTTGENIPVHIPTREELNKKILDYYKYREIGFETVGRFLDELEIALNEIMPYYNQWFFSADQDYDIKYNVNYTKHKTSIKDGFDTSNTIGENAGDSINNSIDKNNTNINMTNNGKKVNVDTPQNQLGLSNMQIDNLTYASDASWNKDTSNSSTNQEGTNVSNNVFKNNEKRNSELSSHEKFDIDEAIKGNYGQVSIQSMILKYRETIRNIEQMIIRDKRISELFMRVY